MNSTASLDSARRCTASRVTRDEVSSPSVKTTNPRRPACVLSRSNDRMIVS